MISIIKIKLNDKDLLTTDLNIDEQTLLSSHNFQEALTVANNILTHPMYTVKRLVIDEHRVF